MAKGYTKINNAVLDDLAKLEISAHDLRVLIFIIRNTICYHKQYREISVGYIASGTGISERQIKRVLKRLSDKNLISVKQQSSGCHPQKIQILGDISGQAWGHFRSSNGDTGVTLLGDTGVTQEIKEEIKDKEIEKEERASLHFSTEKEWRDWMESQEDDDGDI